MKKLLAYLLTAVMLFSCATVSGQDMDNAVQEKEITVSQLEIGDYILLGTYYDQPILWRYVANDENGMLILSDKIICKKPYDVFSGNGTGSHSNRYFGKYQIRTRESYHSNYWGDSNIRSWLNSAEPAGEVVWLCGNPPTPDESYNWPFYNFYADEKGFLADGNFTMSEKTVIKEVTQKSVLDITDIGSAVGGNEAFWNINIKPDFSKVEGIEDFVENIYDELCYEYTTDKLFLLDIKQLWNIYKNKDILGGNYCYTTLTQEAIDNDEEEQKRISENWYDHYSWIGEPLSTEKGADYHLRTPYGYPTFRGRDKAYQSGNAILSVSGDDYNINDESCYVYASDASMNLGIRPAFYLNDANAVILSGSGTEEDPYVVDGKPEERIRVFYDGIEIEFDVPPVIENDRTLVPFRAIFEAMGASVEWEEATELVTGKLNEDTIKLTIGSDTAFVNDKPITLDVAPKLMNDRTLVPLRFVAENFGFKVDWNEAEQRIDINSIK